jgi:hypothetical protein
MRHFQLDGAEVYPVQAQARDELLSSEQARLSSQRRRAQLNLSKRLTERLVSLHNSNVAQSEACDAHSHFIGNADCGFDSLSISVDTWLCAA